MLKNIKLRAKIFLMLLFISLITAGIVGAIAFTLGMSSLEEESYKKLTAIRELKANQIENYFQLLFNQVVSFSEDRMVIEATKEFKYGFDNVKKELDYSSDDLVKLDSTLHSFYDTQFLNKLYYRDSTINYFSIPQDELTSNQEFWLRIYKDEFSEIVKEKGFPMVKPTEFHDSLRLSGSSTVSSLVKHFVKMFNDDGAKGEVVYQSTSTSEGLNDLIDGTEIEIIGSSHILNPEEKSKFNKAGLKPMSFRIGTDALVVVVSEKNTFLSNLSTEELREIFTSAKLWSDINPDWPNELIKRFIPTPGSGSYNLFSEVMLDGDKKILSNNQNTSIIEDGKQMISQMRKDPTTIAFFSYNYFDTESSLKIIEIDGLKLNNTTIRNKSYPFVRPLYLITTESKLKANKNLGILLNYFINMTDKEVGINLDKIEYWPQHANHRILQYYYITNDGPIEGDGSDLFTSFENSSYNTSHQLYHPVFKNYLERFGYYDIFIIDADSGQIIYSTSKEVDFATDLLHGAYRNTNLAEVFKQAVKSDDPNSFYFEDFLPYPPSLNAPASFIASPIFDGDKKIGVLIFQLPIDKINNIMTDGYQWDKVGLGRTGETYLVGNDYLIRNQSRFLIEDSENYFHTLEKIKLSNDIISKIRILQSTIGLQPVITEGTSDAIKGNSGTKMFTDYRGVDVLSSYKPLNVNGVDWVIMSEIDKEEAFEPLTEMFIQFFLWFVFLLALILILSFLFSKSISHPVLLLTERASDLAQGNLEDSIKIERNDEIGFLADNFEKMRCSIRNLVLDLKDINQNLEEKVEQRTEELNRAKEAADAILDKSPVPLALVDVSSAKFVRVNEAMTEFHKLDADELAQHSTTEIYYNVEKDRPLILDQLREFGTLEDFEIHAKRIGTGEERWAILSVHPTSYHGKELYIISLIDITERKEMEQKINQQKTLLENTLESLTHPFYVVDAKDYSLLLANSAAKKLGDTDNNTCYALTHKRGKPCDSKEDPCPLKIIKETKKPVVLEHTHYDPEGNPKIVEVSGYPIFDENGEVIQMIEYSIDITDRKKAEQDLLAANQRFQAIVNNLADALIIINDKGVIEFFSPSAEKLFQYKVVEVMGENVKVLMPAPHHENHDEYLSQYYETGEARVVGIEREVEGKRKDESLFPARLMISEVKTANHHFFVGLIGDLTERKLAEKQLKTQAAAMESAANGIVITNQLGIIQWVNPAFHELTGYKPEELIGNNPSVLKSGKHDDGFYANMWETITQGQVWHDEIINKKKNGDLYYEEMTITPVFDDKGNVIQFVAIKQDISERKRLEAIVLKAKERMEGELNVAKDIQMSMLPLIFPAFPKRNEIDLYAELIPAREVGGDFYDFYFLDENHICFVVGDVSGKGVPAALMMAVTKTLLKSQAGTDKSTASILTHVNNEIAKDNDTYMFITVFMAILNINTGELGYSNAGHNPSFVLNKDRNELIKLGDLHGPVVGAMENMTYKESTLFINKNDIVIAYTDGITEAQNKREELYSDERFMEFLLTHRHENPKEIINQIITSVKTFEDGAEQFDDITVLAVEYIQEPNTVSHDSTSLEIKNDLKEIISVIDQFEDFGTKNNIPFPIVQKFNIAFDELLNNNISYGFKDDKEHLININIELKGSRLIITITDDGKPFNPFVNDPPDTKLNVDERDVGGLGIHIVKNLMDEYEYKRTADKNIITLVKHNINK